MLSLLDPRAWRAYSCFSCSTLEHGEHTHASLARPSSMASILITWLACSLAKHFEQYACYDESAYRQYRPTFPARNTKALPKHQTWDHEIILESSKTFTFEPIYALFEKELKIFRKYLNENLKKKFIQKS